MTISITNGTMTLKGRVIYNFRKIKDIVLIRFDHPYDGKEKEVIFHYAANDWCDINGLQQNFPVLFAKMKYKLMKVFNEAGGFENDIA